MYVLCLKKKIPLLSQTAVLITWCSHKKFLVRTILNGYPRETNLGHRIYSEVHTKIRSNAPFIPAYSGGFEVLAYFHVKFVTQRENTDVKYPFPFTEGVIRLGLRPRRITPSLISMILHKIQPHSLIVNYFT